MKKVLIVSILAILSIAIQAQNAKLHVKNYQDNATNSLIKSQGDITITKDYVNFATTPIVESFKLIAEHNLKDGTTLYHTQLHNQDVYISVTKINEESYTITINYFGNTYIFNT